MNLGNKINEFDNSLGTVNDFNRIFDKAKLTIHDDVCPYPGEVEILAIPLGKPYHRILNVNGTVLEYNMCPPKERKPFTGKKKSGRREFEYKLYRDDQLIEQSTSLGPIARGHFTAIEQHISRTLRKKGEYIVGDLRLTRKKIKE